MYGRCSLGKDPSQLKFTVKNRPNPTQSIIEMVVKRTFWCKHNKENRNNSCEILSADVIDYIIYNSKTNDKIEMLVSFSNGKCSSNQSLKYSTICLVKAGV